MASSLSGAPCTKVILASSIVLTMLGGADEVAKNLFLGACTWRAPAPRPV